MEKFEKICYTFHETSSFDDFALHVHSNFLLLGLILEALYIQATLSDQIKKKT